MNPITTIRGKIIDALADFSYGRKKIPVFDELVNPAVKLPTVQRAETYIVIQDQQDSFAAVQTCCNERRTIDTTIRIVTKFQQIGTKKLCEDIGKTVDLLIRGGRQKSNLSEVQKINLAVNRTMTEVSDYATAYSNILIYEFTLNLKEEGN